MAEATLKGAKNKGGGARVILALLLAVAPLGGCGAIVGSLLPEPDRSVQIWDLQGPLSPCSNDAYSREVMIEPLQSSPWLESRRLGFREGDYEVGYFQFATLTEPPADTLERMLTRWFACSPSEGEGDSAKSDPVRLRWRLLRFEHDARTRPGSAVVMIAASLHDLSDAPISSREFVSEVALESYDAHGAVAGLREASEEITAKLAQWIVQERNRRAQSMRAEDTESSLASERPIPDSSK